jgi:cysteine desulfuration protein SufE
MQRAALVDAPGGKFDGALPNDRSSPGLPAGSIRAQLRVPMTIASKQQELLDELALFQDWTERYEYVIGLGRKLAPMAGSSKNPEHLIKGCQSQVWLDSALVDGRVRYSADSDSLITKGMIALFVRVLDGETPDDILTADMDFIDRTGLKEHLAPTRANALNLMATQMKQRALAHVAGDGITSGPAAADGSK